MSYGYRLEATYSSGFVLLEDALDQSPWRTSGNVWHAISSRDPERHGKGSLERLRLVPDADDGRPALEVDVAMICRQLGVEPTPVYYRRMSAQMVPPGSVSCSVHVFGYRYTTSDGEERQTLQAVPGKGGR